MSAADNTLKRTEQIMVILRTDAGVVMGSFKNTRTAQAHAETLPADMLAKILVVQTVDGIVLSRRFPDQHQDTCK